MKVILCENVPNLGEMGATVTVNDGYARNYLLPRRLAVQADSGSAKQIEHEIRNIRRREEKVREKLREQAKVLGKATVNITMRAGAEDKLYGSVTTKHIADKLNEQGFEVDRKSVELDEPIKSLGVFTVPVKLGLGVEANVKVWVEKEQEAEPEAAAEAAETAAKPAAPAAGEEPKETS